MKKLEVLLERLRVLFGVEEEIYIGKIWNIDITKKRTASDIVEKIILNIIAIVFVLAFMGLFLGLAIMIAIESNNYLFLSIMISLVTYWIVVNFKKEFFEKLNNYLRETPKATVLIFWIIYAVVFVLSWKYFIGVIFSIILAFMFADYMKNDEE